MQCIKPLPVTPASHMNPGSLLTARVWSSSLLQKHLGKQRKVASVPSPCHPGWRPARSSWILALVWPSLAVTAIWGVKQQRDLSISMSLYLILTFKQIKIILNIIWGSGMMAQWVKASFCMIRDHIWMLACVPAALLAIWFPNCGLGRH